MHKCSSVRARSQLCCILKKSLKSAFFQGILLAFWSFLECFNFSPPQRKQFMPLGELDSKDTWLDTASGGESKWVIKGKREPGAKGASFHLICVNHTLDTWTTTYPWTTLLIWIYCKVTAEIYGYLACAQISFHSSCPQERLWCLISHHSLKEKMLRKTFNYNWAACWPCSRIYDGWAKAIPLLILRGPSLQYQLPLALTLAPRLMVKPGGEHIIERRLSEQLYQMLIHSISFIWTALCHSTLGAENTKIKDLRYHHIFYWLIIFLCMCQDSICKDNLLDWLDLSFTNVLKGALMEGNYMCIIRNSC